MKESQIITRKIEKEYSFMNAKEIALSNSCGCARRAKKENGEPSNLTGFKDTKGNAFVVGDMGSDLPEISHEIRLHHSMPALPAIKVN